MVRVRNSLSILFLFLIIIGAGYTFFAQLSIARASMNACGGWSVVKSQNVSGTSYNFLNGVASASSSNVWTVGYAANSTNSYTLIENWNGTAWTIVSSPSLGVIDSLQAVAVVPGSNEAWAVGYYYPSNAEPSLPLIEYWNGTAWSVVTGPTPSHGQLNGVVALSSTNVWAVGQYDDSNLDTLTLIEHWNGTAWSIISSPNGSTSSGTSPYNILRAVWAASSTNIWAVGDFSNTDVNQEQPLMENWNGVSWNIVKSAVAGTGDNYIQGVSGSKGKDVWAVGTTPTGSFTSNSIIEHWNGTTWSVVSTPMGGTADNFYAVVALSSANAWAVGSTVAAGGSHGITLTEHWNGTSWTVVASPNEGKGENEFFAVARIPSASQLWAVGYSSGNHTLTEYYC